MMNSVTEYVEATVSIFFEPEHVGCQWCPLMTTYSRNQCMRTGELLIDTRVVGKWCPLNFKEENNEPF